MGVAIALFMGGIRARALERSRAADKIGGCVSCGSTNLETDNGMLRCLECGYSGRADRGGEALSKQDLDASLEREPYDFWD